MRDLPVLKLNLNEPETFGNLAESLEQNERRTMAQDLIALVGVDENSMNDWLGKAKGYLDEIEDDGPAKPDTTEQQGANEKNPPSTEMTLSAVIQFSARATDALLGEPDLAHASEVGAEPLASWVSSQLRTQDPEWLLDTDPLVIHMAVTGLAWRKRNYDDEDKVFRSHFLPCTDVIINKNVRSIERAPRITHQYERYPYEIERSIERGRYVDYDPKYNEADPQAPKKFYEMDCWLDLDGDGLDEPWTITISRDDVAEVIRVRPRWSKKTVTDTAEALFFNPIRRFYPYKFLPDPKGGFFPMGFGKLLDRTENAADNLLGSIIDTAKSEAENGGILAGGGFGLPASVELKGNRVETVNTDGRKLGDMFQPFPVKSVSAGSVAVLEKIMSNGERLAGTLNVLDKAPASMSATMAKGIIDTGAQIQSAVHRRMVASITQEIRMFVQMADAYDALPPELTGSDKGAVALTADPQLATEMQRSALAGVYMDMIAQAAKGVPWDMKELQMRVARVMRLPQPEKLIGQPQVPQLTPDEKAKAVLGGMKLQIEKMKVTGAVAQQLTQALKNMVEASGGMLSNQAALLTMAQLEQAVQGMLEGNANVGSGIEGMAGPNPNQNAAGLPAPAPGAAAPVVPEGAADGPGSAGPGSGLA